MYVDMQSRPKQPMQLKSWLKAQPTITWHQSDVAGEGKRGENSQA